MIVLELHLLHPCTNRQSYAKANDGNSLCHHHLHELFVIDLTIAIDICLPDHLINLLIGEFFSEIGHDVTQLCGTDEAIAVTVKHLEGLNQFFLRVCVFHLACHQGKKLWEINGSVTISIDFVDHILEFRLGGVLSQGTHHSAQLLGGDGSITVFVEEGEGLLELGNLLLGQLVGHGYEVKQCNEDLWKRKC